MGSTKSAWFANRLWYYDESTYETVRPIVEIYFEDDFLNTQIMTAAAGVVGWTEKETGSGAAAIVANQHGGIVALALDATNEKQEAGIYFGDALNFNLDKGPVIEIRATPQVAPTDQAELYFGLANAYVEGPIAEADAGPTVHAFFCFDGGLACTIHTDDASNDSNAVATGVTAVAGTYNIYRIDFTDVSDVKFYIDGTRVASTTTFNMSNGTNVVVQPFLMAHKETGTGLGTLRVDYVRVWSPR